MAPDTPATDTTPDTPSNIISLADRRAQQAADEQESQPHWTGVCRCVGCQHEWRAVAPIGIMWIDCPSCGFPKGHPKHPFGDASGCFTCKCGAEAMTVFRIEGYPRVRCMGCGIDHTDTVFTLP